VAVKDTRAAKRYATALFQAAVTHNKLEQVEKDFTELLQAMEKAPALRRYWESPLVPSGRKREQIKELLGESIDPLTLSFLRLLVDKRREDLLDTIDQELRQNADAARHLVRAEVTFAVAPTDAEKQSLQSSLEKRTGENVLLTVHVDPTILGGVVVRLQDTIIDGSVRGTLERVREQLLHEA
jgi:F-type H+-transporting ATPase subunit delta